MITQFPTLVEEYIEYIHTIANFAQSWVVNWYKKTLIKYSITSSAPSPSHYLIQLIYYTLRHHLCRSHWIQAQRPQNMDFSIIILSTLSNQKSCAVSNYENLSYFQVYCTCRMPWNPNGSEKEDMVQCPECGEWYHKGCVRIPPTAYCPITGAIENYTCRPCIDRGVAVL